MENKNVEFKAPPECMKELVVGDKIYGSTFDFNLTEADMEKARKELKETDEVVKKSLQEMKKLLSKHADFECRTDDAFLLRYLRYQKFDSNKAYKRYRNFYKTRNEHPELFITVHLFDQVGDCKFGNILPYKDEEGSIVIIHRIADWELERMEFYDLMRIFISGSDCLSLNPHAQIHGVIDIFDFGGTTARHFSKLVSCIPLSLKVMQEIYPFRIRRIILLNCNSLLYACWTSIRCLIKKKIADRLVLLRSDLEDLHKYVSPNILPQRYGGHVDDELVFNYGKTVAFNNKEYLKYEQSFVKPKKS